MELEALIEGLRRPGVLPGTPGGAEVVQTHISVVFLGADRVWKIKKPVDLGWLDYATLEQRRRMCEAEVRLNRRLAPGVYRGVVPVVPAGGDAAADVAAAGGDSGPALRIGDADDPDDAAAAVEWAVEMERLPESATLRDRLAAGEVDADVIRSVARRLAEFHGTAARGPDVSASGDAETFARVVRDTLHPAEAMLGRTVADRVWSRLQVLVEQHLTLRSPLIHSRAARNLPCDAHGDLRLDHVYLFPDREPPDDLVIVDCIEFNDDFRWIDPACDTAFLVMDLAMAGRRDLARVLEEEWCAASDDAEAADLMPLYVAYRSQVRGMVESLKALEREVPAEARVRAAETARGHWLLAYGELAGPTERPALVRVMGLPGTGKSTIAAGLTATADLRWVRSDAERRRLAGLEPGSTAPLGDDRYTREWSDRTYAACLERTEAILRQGGRAVVDAVFLEEHRREPFRAMARRLGVRDVGLVIEADPAHVRRWLEHRTSDVSDADWSVHEKLRRSWEPDPTAVRVVNRGPHTGVVGAALQALRDAGVA